MFRRVIVEGREVAVDGDQASIVEVEPGVYSVLMGGRSYEARIHEGEVEIRGRRFTVQVVDPRDDMGRGRGAGPDGRQTLISPMPGRVVRVLVAEGDAVTSGQGLVIVEAMKMQNEMKSPKDGTVVSVPVQEGSTVGAGDVLAIIE